MFESMLSNPLLSFTTSQVRIVRAIVTEFVFFKSDPRGEHEIYRKLVDDMHEEALARRFNEIILNEIDFESPMFNNMLIADNEPSQEYSQAYLYYLVSVELKSLDEDERAKFIQSVLFLKALLESSK